MKGRGGGGGRPTKTFGSQPLPLGPTDKAHYCIFYGIFKDV